MKLNEEQMAAVTHPLGEPACLIAGAGSGKTRVLTERVKWLIEQQGVPPRKIVAITFTNKAAHELLERLEFDPDSKDIPKVSTIHSLALSAIRKNPTGFGLQEKVTPLDDYDQSQMIRKIVDRTIDVKEQKISLSSYVYGLLEKISFHRSRGLGFSAEYTDDVHERALTEHAGYHALEPLDRQIWALYEVEKQKNSVVDFDDMLHLVVRRLRTDDIYRASLHKMFDHVLMDEAQDTNPVQWEFINFLLSPDNKNMYVVGDMSQCIYAFNGALPRILKEYSENWRGQFPKLYRIARNHRSLPRIVYLANRIQSKMTATIPLKMEAFRGDEQNKGVIELTRASLPADVAMIIAGEIAKDGKRKVGHIPYKDNAILVRSARQIPDIENALVRYRIPYVVRGGRGLLQTEEVRDVMSYLRLITNPKDFTALVRAVGVPKRGVGDVALEKIRRVAGEKHDGDLIRGAASVEKLNMFVQSLDSIQRFRDYPVQALEKIIILMDYNNYLATKYKKEPDKVKSKLENLERFKEVVRGLSEDQQLSTEDLVFQLTLDRAREDDQNGQVTISTIHCSPPDEPVLTTKGYKSICELNSDIDRLYSYIPKCNQLARGQRNGAMDYHGGYKFTVKTRPYKGELVVIDTPYSHTRVTPEHRVRASFSEAYYGKWVVYLMRRGDWWRVGTCTSASIPYKAGGIPGRLAAEKGDAGWILGVYSERNAALAAEIDYQVRYGIPALCFEKWKSNVSRNTVYSIHENLKDVVAPRAHQLLQEKGLLLDEPLYRRDKTRNIMLNACWFDTVAANLLDGYMQVPVVGEADFRAQPPNSPRPCVANIKREFYNGQVFSLDVVPHKYYISGGIVVHNSAKGLEWPRVFMTNLVEGSIPHKFSMGSEDEIQEEMRLLYVGCTRARDILTLCVQAMQPQDGGADTRRVAPSRFLVDLGIVAA